MRAAPYILHSIRLLGLSLFFVLGTMLQLGRGPELLFWSLFTVARMVPVLALLVVLNRYEGQHGLGRLMMPVAAIAGYICGWLIRDLDDAALWLAFPIGCVIVGVIDLIIGYVYRRRPQQHPNTVRYESRS